MTTALFHLRAIQLGLTMRELDMLNHGDVLDMFAESINDQHNWRELATQEDFDRF